MRRGDRVDNELLQLTNSVQPVAEITAASDNAVDALVESPADLYTKADNAAASLVTQEGATSTDTARSNSKQLAVPLEMFSLPEANAVLQNSGQKQQQKHKQQTKQSRQSSADTCDSELHPNYSSSSNSSSSMQALQEDQSMSSSKSSARTSSAASDTSSYSNSCNSECDSSFSFFRERTEPICSDSSSSSTKEQQKHMQPGDTPRFGPAAQFLQRLVKARRTSNTGQQQWQQRRETASGFKYSSNISSEELKSSSHLGLLQKALSELRSSTLAARKRIRELQLQQQQVSVHALYESSIGLVCRTTIARRQQRDIFGVFALYISKYFADFVRLHVEVITVMLWR